MVSVQALALLSNAYLEPAKLCRIAAIVVLEKMSCSLQASEAQDMGGQEMEAYFIYDRIG